MSRWGKSEGDKESPSRSIKQFSERFKFRKLDGSGTKRLFRHAAAAQENLRRCLTVRKGEMPNRQQPDGCCLFDQFMQKGQGLFSINGFGTAEARHMVARFDLCQRGLCAAAAIRGIGAAGCKAACRRRIDGRTQFSLQDDPFLSPVQTWNGDRGKQRLRIGVQRMVE